MKLPRPLALALVLAAFALAALPALSFAQSAGDDQYQDPLGGGSATTPSTPSTPASPSSGSSSSSGTQAPAPSASAASSPSKTSHAAANVPLAHTGFDAWIPGLAGVLLLAGGAALLLVPRRQAHRR